MRDKVNGLFVKTIIAYNMNLMVCDLLELVRVLKGEMKTPEWQAKQRVIYWNLVEDVRLYLAVRAE